MPIKYEQENPELYEEAKRLFFEEHVKSPAEIRNRLIKKFGKNNVPHWRTIWRWCKEFTRNKVIQEGIATLVKEEASTDKELEPLALDKRLHRPSSLRDKEIPKPPTLTELVESFRNSGVSPKLAPELLANWDIAFREDDYLHARACERAVAILIEIPGIPYKNALDHGMFVAKLEYFEIDGLKESGYIFDLINIWKRYRPWEGKENRKAYQKMLNWWFEKTKPIRDKHRFELESAMRNLGKTTISQEEGK